MHLVLCICNSNPNGFQFSTNINKNFLFLQLDLLQILLCQTSVAQMVIQLLAVRYIGLLWWVFPFVAEQFVYVLRHIMPN